MRQVLVLFLIPLMICSQYTEPLDDNELDDPDENRYLDELLTAIFQPHSIETADSNTLFNQGYSMEAIGEILDWQGSGRDIQHLRKKIHGPDLVLLKSDLKQETQQTQIQLRQRIQYSPSLKGWRILNKGHLQNRWGSLAILSEQDPGEQELTDHTIVSLSSQSIPWVDHLIIGDYHVSWGGGLILNQQGSRLSLNPGSLLRPRQSTIRPHYSSREIDYFRGVASSFSIGDTHGSAFISSRRVAGARHEDEFTDDGDGIHPVGRVLDYRQANNIGLALERFASGILIYVSTVYNPYVNKDLGYELGLSSNVSSSQKIQIYTNSIDLNNHRMIGTWAYHSPTLQVSLQLRHYSTDEIIALGAIPTLLGSSASNEKGFSVRAQLYPINKLRIRYAVDTSVPTALYTAQDYRTIQQHKIQIIWKLTAGVFQLDLSKKNDLQNLVGDSWDGDLSNRRLTKGAVSITHLFPHRLQYRLNMKTAFQQNESAFLVQQRLSQEKGHWKWGIGYVRFDIPEYAVRLSVYETSVAESFGFYTAYDDGDRWFLYLKQRVDDWFQMELKVVRTRSFEIPLLLKQLALSLQMSIVL